MKKEEDKILDLFCTATALKEKMRSYYEDAMKNCSDPVGVETFRMLKSAEEEHLERIKAMHEEALRGKVSADACQFHDFEAHDRKALLRRVAKAQDKIPKACLDDVAAIETGLTLENEAVLYFTKRLETAAEPFEKAFLDRLIVGEREHHILLADLKFYYEDPDNWLLEKGRQVLDGAGAGT